MSINKSQPTLDSLFKFEKTVKKFSFKSDEHSSEDEDKIDVKKETRKKLLLSSDNSDKEDNQEKKKKFNESDVKNNLTRLFEMFPTMSQLKIKTIWKKTKFNVKEAIDQLLEEDKNNQSISSSSSSNSDKSKIREDSPKSSKSDRKRKLDENKENLKEPLKKKHRKILDSSSEDEEDSKNKKIKIKKNLINSDNESGAENESYCDKAKVKNSKKISTNKKKKIIEDEEDQEKEDQEDDDFYSDDTCSNNSESSLTRSDLSLRDSVLSFFNKSTSKEIASLISISTKKLDILIELRPFVDYKDLQNRLDENSLSNLIDSAKEILQAREIVNELMRKCESISQNLQMQMSKCIDKQSIDIDVNTSLKIKSQPAILNSQLALKPYQLIGLNWLCLMHSEKINGILADEMGLGKTIQAIAFLAFLIESGFTGVHLIVVPPSTLDNWLNEIESWCPSINYLIYTGSQDERRHLRYDILENNFEKPLNVVITSYSLISSTTEDKAFFKKMKFDYCVFDEAHMLKNMTSIRYQSLIKITSKRKLLLTGTPLQNNLVELMSLLNFVMPDIFNHRTHHINKLFGAKTGKDTDSYYEGKINQAKSIMKPFILRRLKTEVLQNLPNKIINIIQCQMTERQLKEYNELINGYVNRSNIIAEVIAGEDNPVKDSKENKENPSNIIMELRKAACHPLLRRCLYHEEKLREMSTLVLKESSPDTVFEYVLEDMSVMSDFQLHKLCSLYKGLKNFELSDADILNSGKFKVLNNLLEEKKAKGEKVLIFSQFVIMLDIIEDYLKIKKYQYSRLDGSTAVMERQDMIDEFNTSTDKFVFLLSTRAGGMGINLTSANNVILHDIDYNPFNDKQAEDRCHRVGQTREVEIHKLISTDSIDESMLKIQNRKIELGENLTNEKNESLAKTDMVSLLKEALKLKD